MKLISKGCAVFFALIMFQSCVLEERYHFNEDLSGTYEVSFGVKSFATEEEGEGSMIDEVEMRGEIEKMEKVEGFTTNSVVIDSTSFDVSAHFADLSSINKAKGETEKLPDAEFITVANKFSFVGESFFDGDNPDEIQETDDGEKYFTHRVVITFEKKIKRLKSKNFKKLNNHTLVYDSDKIPGVSKLKFELKLK